MNSFKIIGIISIISVSSALQSMEQLQSPLSTIEKQLVLREVARYGTKLILSKIHNGPNGKPQEKYCNERDLYYTQHPTLLKIKITFVQNQADKDTLTKIIFDRIMEIEKELGYRPEVKVAKKEKRQGGPPTNYLGNHTRYYWVKEDPKKTMSGVVKVKSYFPVFAKESLLEIVKNGIGGESCI